MDQILFYIHAIFILLCIWIKNIQFKFKFYVSEINRLFTKETKLTNENKNKNAFQ